MTDSVDTVESLRAEVAALKFQLSELDLDHRADRCHLRDDTTKAKARAYNLLAEDIIEPLKLVMSALDRPAPKVAVALHHVDLALERAMESLPRFKC